jgi:hypothetical protein
MNAELHIGARVRLETDGLQIECVVTGTKTVYGRDCIQVQPVAGEGRTWVNAPRVAPILEAAPEVRA